jgi:hypothetical protein
MICAHLLESRSAASTLEHFLQKLHQLVGYDVITKLLGGVFNYVVLPLGVYLLLQQRHSVGQPVAAMPIPIEPRPFSSLTQLARVVTIGISNSTDSSTHVASYSGRQPTKGECWTRDFCSKTTAYASP